MTNILDDYEGLTAPQTHAVNMLLAAQIARQVVPECAEEFDLSAFFMAGQVLKPAEFGQAKAVVSKLLDRIRGAS
ncbi:hypothetical protein GGE07_001528 [Sinorhizobium terangae]|uniref:Uncharacterized protein n=1 Tax=Sinorhizobium terangae TaxID=110322 RepID=A0A6N7LL94_SINTE|nr:hypothetical protein [Sinorhizobium terangae]MBB4184899.1 hypothetical protein [Sinorhizobium terangae]MQX18416.1 hypothetical protein [Sinorhizobium terangae]